MQLAFASDSAVIEAQKGWGGSVVVRHVLHNAAASIDDLLRSHAQGEVVLNINHEQSRFGIGVDGGPNADACGLMRPPTGPWATQTTRSLRAT